MGQKVNSNALRLYRNKNWSTQSFIDSSNYDKILVQDLFIQDYIKSVLFRYNIFCTNVVIKRLDNLVHIYIYFYNDKLFSLLRPKGSRSVISHKKFITSKDYRFLNFIRFKQSSQKKLFLNYILKKTIKGVPFKKFSELEGLCTKKEFKDFVRKSYFEFQNV